MKEEVEKRFEMLKEQGNLLTQNLRKDEDGGLNYYIEEFKIPEYQAWISSCVNLIRLVARPNTHFVEESKRLVTDKNMAHGIPAGIIQKIYGLLNSAHDEWKYGLLRDIEYIVAAETFDDFLDHAATYHKGNKITEASVLASAVLEDTIKKIAARNDLQGEGKSLEPLIDELAKENIFTAVKSKRVKSYAGVRNHALHAEWDKIDIRDVGEMIRGIRELVENYL